MLIYSSFLPQKTIENNIQPCKTFFTLVTKCVTFFMQKRSLRNYTCKGLLKIQIIMWKICGNTMVTQIYNYVMFIYETEFEHYWGFFKCNCHRNNRGFKNQS